jgi:multicomponent K+:H+ antiporter subunit A
LPLLGDLHLATTLLFDIGVYMLVAGSAVLILVSIAHQSMRSKQKLALALARQQEINTWADHAPAGNDFGHDPGHGLMDSSAPADSGARR